MTIDSTSWATEQGGNTRPSSIACAVDRPSGLHGRNRIAEAFFDGPGWRRFRFWERLFLKVQGGEARARRQILQHLNLNGKEKATVLEVGIGDGANVALLPEGWTILGVDIARNPLCECLAREPKMSGRLSRSEGESLPFGDAVFDACWSLGGFNYFRDHGAALREMRRVTRPGGILIVADEIPNLHRFGIGHLIGVPRIDALWLKALGLDDNFIRMVFELQFDPHEVIPEHWPGATHHRIWCGLGYCYVLANNQSF